MIIGIKALQTIFANFACNLNEEWIIPMRVIKLQDSEKLVLILDSPLVKALAKTPLEKYKMFLRKATKHLLIKPWNEKVQEAGGDALDNGTPFPETRRASNDFKDDLFDSSQDVDLSALETFGQGAQLDGNDTDESAEDNLVIDESLDENKRKSSLSSSPVKPTRKRVTRSSTKSDSSDHDQEEVKGMPLKKRPFATPQPTSKPADTLLSSIIDSQKSLRSQRATTKANQRAHQEVFPPAIAYDGHPIFVASHGNAHTDYISPTCSETKNFHYRTWFLRPKNSIKDSLTLLVKGSTHGLREGDQKPVTVSSKIEGQLPFGLEQMSKTEMAHDWLATMLRQDSCLVRPRINVEDQNVLHIDVKSLKELTQDGLEDQAFNPAHSLGNIYTLLSNLKGHINEPGQYLLRHDAKTGPFVKVMKSTDQDHSGKSYDLHANYLTVHASQDLKLRASFRPFDNKTVTPLHTFHGRVPGLFAPPTRGDMRLSPSERGGRGGRGRGGRGGRGRGGRGRNRGRGRGGK